MQTFERIVNFLNDLVWNTPEVMPLMVVVLLSYGLFITVRLGFIQIRKLKHGFRVLTGYYDDPNDQGDINHFQALSTALSATVGIGNIAGVALAIHYGGPGALFWMWITAIFGMAIKYSECTLAVLYREQNDDGSVSGGPMYYIEKGLGSNWKWLSIVFAVSAVICSFLTGNAIQANTVADSMESAFMIPVYITGLFTAGFVAIVILGGIKRIGNVTAKLTPLMAVLYVFGALVILLMNYDMVIPTLGLIITSAFDPVAGVLGVGSGAFMTTLVWGIKRGLFSNEAGQGSAPIAHAAAKTDEPVREGVVALLEPFIDTLVVCTMTGLVICITGAWDAKHPSAIFINSGDTSFAIEETVGFEGFDDGLLIVNNGVPANGNVMRYGILIDTLYADAAQSQLFNGTIYTGPGTKMAYDPDNNQIRELFGNVVENGAPLTARAFEIGLSPILPGGAYLVTICVLLFGVSTSISWSYYGDRSIQYLLGDRSIIYYRVVYIIMHFVGAILALGTVWAIGDVALGLMTLPNLIALFALSGVVYRVTHEYFNRMEAEDLNS
ncbi:MAG: sodium:alanine symporter family protein [Balneolaceae bacterium]|nr:MAG: sodium:alanine symporter family protein [Balneolaceae bacterium]